MDAKRWQQIRNLAEGKQDVYGRIVADVQAGTFVDGSTKEQAERYGVSAAAVLKALMRVAEEEVETPSGGHLHYSEGDTSNRRSGRGASGGGRPAHYFWMTM
jgi:diaminopimelate decarboxylase